MYIYLYIYIYKRTHVNDCISRNLERTFLYLWMMSVKLGMATTQSGTIFVSFLLQLIKVNAVHPTNVTGNVTKAGHFSTFSFDSLFSSPMLSGSETSLGLNETSRTTKFRRFPTVLGRLTTSVFVSCKFTNERIISMFSGSTSMSDWRMLKLVTLGTCGKILRNELSYCTCTKTISRKLLIFSNTFRGSSSSFLLPAVFPAISEGHFTSKKCSQKHKLSIPALGILGFFLFFYYFKWSEKQGSNKFFLEQI